jgi:ubiquinone/menaquinone biosynthesis C-methylase UbiE
VQLGDADGALPFADSSFDGVVLKDLLEHLADPVATVREARRVAGPDGLVVVWDLRRTARAVSAAFLRRELGPGLRTQTSTLVPPVARRLGPATERLYPLLVRLPPLRTHWFAWAPGA